MVKKYPLDALQRVRAVDVEQKARDLAEAERACAALEDQLADRTRCQADFEERCRESADAERDRLEQGRSSAGDLARAADWSAGAVLRAARYEGAVKAAQGALEPSRAEVALRRDRLAKAHAEAGILQRDRARWARACESARSAAEDEDAEDAHRARPSARSRT